MSIPKPRHFTYYERIKSTLQSIQHPETKVLCTDLLNFIGTSNESKSMTLDFTDAKSSERISQFLLKDTTFFNRTLENYLNFSKKGHFDLFSNEDSLKKDLNKSRILIAIIEKLCYQIICLSTFYSPIELQKANVLLLSKILSKHNTDASFGSFELTVWTALLLMVNSVKLKQQCDGSVEVFSELSNVLKPEWANLCLKGTVQLSLGISIKYARNSLGLGIPHEIDEIELVEEGLKNMAIEFLQAYFVNMPSFCDYSLSVDVLDSILKNFISYFPDKLVEMYNLCEEELYSLSEYSVTENPFDTDEQKTLRQMNSQNLHFKAFLELIASLYKYESSQLTQLSMEFTNPNYEDLCDFIYRGRAISVPALKISYLSMLCSLCKNTESADEFFNIFK